MRDKKHMGEFIYKCNILMCLFDDDKETRWVNLDYVDWYYDFGWRFVGEAWDLIGKKQVDYQEYGYK